MCFIAEYKINFMIFGRFIADYTWFVKYVNDQGDFSKEFRIRTMVLNMG